MDPGYGLVPRQAYRYWPSDSEAIKGSGRFAMRMIFRRQAYSDTEEQALEELTRLIDTRENLSPRASKVDRADLLRLVYACGWNLREAVAQLEAYLNWTEVSLSAIRQLGPAQYLPILVCDMLDEWGTVYTGQRLLLSPTAFPRSTQVASSISQLVRR